MDNANMRQIASLLGKINTITNHKFVRNVKAHPIDVYVDLATGRFVEQSADL